MKTTLLLAAALSLGLAGAAGAQAAPAGGPTAKGNAPVKHVHTVNDGAAKPGHNSFTEGQARQHILNSGYTAVTGLSKGSDGVWRGRASKGGGAPEDVAMDFKGNVTQGGGGMHGGGMNAGGMNAGGGRGGGMSGRGGNAGMSNGAGMGGSTGGGMRHGAMAHDGHSADGGSTMHHGRHHRHVRHHLRHAHRHHHHGGVGMSGVDRNDNGISDKEDRARRH